MTVRSERGWLGMVAAAILALTRRRQTYQSAANR